MNRILLSLSTLLVCSCVSSEKIASTGIQSVEFGFGGGFTGLEVSYSLDTNGNVTDDNKSVIRKVTKKEIIVFFQQAKQIKGDEYDRPGNTYSFITIYSDLDTNRIAWGVVSDSLKGSFLLHQDLMKIVKPTNND